MRRLVGCEAGWDACRSLLHSLQRKLVHRGLRRPMRRCGLLNKEHVEGVLCTRIPTHTASLPPSEPQRREAEERQRRAKEAEMARAALELGFYLGVDGPLTYKKATDLQQMVAALPLDHLLIETDAPFLTPHPHRGKRNEPAYVAFTAKKVAELKGLSVPEVGRATADNAIKLFGIKRKSDLQ